ncbi:MAG: adenine deaminase [Fluviicola sp.]|nr:adenine deaminase [Fluviicola sp.]
MLHIQGKIVDIVQRTIVNGELIIEDGLIKKIIPNELPSEHYIIPGFVDAHVHVESSMLIPSEFARLAVCHGTVGTISDPHEIGNVLGVEGVKYMIENGAKTPFKFYFGAPSCVPATVFETAGATIDLEGIRDLFALPRVNYLAEMMNFPGVLHKDQEVMAKIQLAHDLGKRVDGHAPGLRGEAAKTYIDAGITTDHECFTLDEALDKLSFGMKIQIREGSAAKNFEALWTLIDSHTDKVMLCSDDKHPNDLVRGHINLLAKRAIAKGCKLFNVLQVCSKNTIDHYGMEIGYLQTGQTADFCLVKDLTDFEVVATYIDGKLVAQNGETLIPSVNERIINHFNREPIALLDLKIPAQSKDVQVIEVEDGQLITNKGLATLSEKNACLESDVEQDVLKLVVVNRYENKAPALAFIKNMGLKKGAIASCVAHDSHNIIAVGTKDEDLCSSINAIIAAKGGVSLANGDQHELVALPVAGIMSAEDGYKVAKAYEEIDQAAKALGTPLNSPFMTLSFCALLVIPSLKLSDKGLFDGDQFSFTSLYR